MLIDVSDTQHFEVTETTFSIYTDGCRLYMITSSGGEITLRFRDYEEALKFRANLECIVDVAPKLGDTIDGKVVFATR
jgi:hypothetical protein